MKKSLRIVLLLTLLCQYAIPVTTMAQENSSVNLIEHDELHSSLEESKKEETKETIDSRTDEKTQNSSEESNISSTEQNNEDQPNAPPVNARINVSEDQPNVFWSLEATATGNDPTYLVGYQVIDGAITKIKSFKLSKNYNRPNQLAMKNGEFYFYTRSGNFIHVDKDGNVKEEFKASEMLETIRSADVDTEGNYVSFRDPALSGQKKLIAYKYNLENKSLVKEELSDPLGVVTTGILNSLGDVAITNSNIMYGVGSDSNNKAIIVKIDLNTNTIIDYFNPKGLSHSPAVAFLDDGKIVFSIEKTKEVFTLDFSSGILKKIGVVTGYSPMDFARSSFPSDFPEVENPKNTILKSGPESANVGETYTYSMEVKNDGGQVSTGTHVQDNLPPGFHPQQY